MNWKRAQGERPLLHHLSKGNSVPQWTDDEVESLKALRREKWSYGYIARKLGKTREAVAGQLRQIRRGKTRKPVVSGHRAAHGPRDRAEFSPGQDDRIIHLILDGVTHREVALDLLRDCNEVTTRIAYLRKVGLLPPTSGRHWKNQVRKAEPRDITLAMRADEPVPLARADGAPVTMANVRQDGECKWPHGIPGAADFRLCGHPAKGSWCEHHFGRVFPKRVVTAA